MKSFVRDRIRRGDNHVHIISDLVSSDQSESQHDDADSDAETEAKTHLACFDELTSPNSVEDTVTEGHYMTNIISDFLSAENPVDPVDLEQDFRYGVHHAR